MKQLVFAVALFLAVPSLRAQQGGTGGDPAPSAPQGTQPAPQVSVQNPVPQEPLPAELRPGHPLNSADVDILTGKREREIEAARQTATPAILGAYGEYGYYGDYTWLNGRLGAPWDIPMLPLSRITNPFFFSRIAPRGFGRGGFRGGR